jgi:hypothetical protein
MDPAVHKRFLEYRERFVYFGRGGLVILTKDEFVVADAEQRTLESKGEARDRDEEERFVDLSRLLFRD